MADGYRYYAKDFKKNSNEFPLEFTNRIVNGDSIDVLKKLPDDSVDIVFTSPPYNFGMSYDTHDDVNEWKDYFDFLWKIFDECIRVVKYGGRIVVNIQPQFRDYIPTHHIITNGFMERGLIWRSEILWEKNHRNCATTAWGSWKSPSSPYLKYTWEFVEVFCKGDLKHDGDSDNIDITGNEFKTWVDAKWSIAPEKRMKDFGHPAMFPPELAYRVLKLFSFKNDVVLDPFNGGGTTSLVAERTGRRYLGIDLSPDYCEIAERRIKEEVLKDYSAILDAKLSIDGKDKSLKERESQESAKPFSLFDA
jgi:DNA modification methylase